MNINDTAFPPSTHISFGDLTAGDAYRTLAAAYRVKTSGNTAFDFGQGQAVSQSSGDAVEKVTATLVITAP